jgi:tRNA pseudouridine38-40 synthase
MPKFKVSIEYDGGNYVGWQKQNNGPSIQEALEHALESFSGMKTEVIGAGRTDSGVHALSMTAHFELESEQFSIETIKKAMNYHLGKQPITVLEVIPIDQNFHARFSAINRKYLYRILNRATPPALDIGRVWFVPRRLNEIDMQKAAAVLIGKHDFTSFRAKHCQALSPEKTIRDITVNRIDDEIQIFAEAKSFLHHQVRNIVGTLKQVGEGRWTEQDVIRILKAKDRSIAGPTAPAAGLYFAGADYDDNY